jgi:hypothetical protein
MPPNPFYNCYQNPFLDMDAEGSSEDDFKIEDVLERVGDVHDCPHCGEVFSSLVEVEGHISIEHGKLIF